MAKLTARFDMQDRITNKLKKVRTEAEKLERSRAKINRPMTITVRDRATRPLQKVRRLIARELDSRMFLVRVGMRDLASKPIRAMSTFMKRRMPKTHDVILKAVDRATPMITKLRRYMVGNIIGARMIQIQAKDRATPVIQKIKSYASSSLSKGYSFTVRAVDMVTKTTGRIGNYINNQIPKAVSTTIRVVDLATRPLQMIANAATSTLGVLGVAGGLTGGIAVPVKMVADRENITTAFEVMLGSRGKAEQRLAELTDFAGRTPLTRDEIFRSSRVLQTFTGEALSTAKGMELVGDVAVGTQTPLEETALWFGRLYDGIQSGRPIGDATSRLQEMGAISGAARGRIEKLAEAGGDIEKIWPKVTKEFSTYNGMMEKMSHNMSNLLLGLKSFVGNYILIPWGEGLTNAFKPALLAFREWRGEYSFVLKDMSRQLKSWGTKFADNLLKPTSGVLKTIGDQMKILFPGMSTYDALKTMDLKDYRKYKAELEVKLKDDPEFKKRWDQLEKYRDMTFQARWEIVKGNVSDGMSEWWETTGRAKAQQLGENIGKTYGGFIKSAILTLLGGEAEETGNPFVDAGATAGKSFISGFIEALDPGMLARSILKKLGEINLGGMKSVWGRIIGDEELQSQGSFWGMMLADALVLAFMARVAPMFRMLKWLGGAVLNPFGLWGKIGKGGKGGKGGGGGTVVPAGGTKAEKSRKNQKKPPSNKPNVYTHPWFNKGQKHQTNIPNAGKAAKDTGKLTKALGSLGKFGKFAKGIPFLGTAIGALQLATSSKGERAGIVGSLGGGAAGAMLGGTVGSVVPVVGTAIGAIGGGILGSIGGEKLMNKWFGGGNKVQAAELSETGSNMSMDGIDMSVVRKNIELLAMYLGNASGWVFAAFQPLEGSGAILSHNMSTLSEYMGQASGWIVEGLYPFQEGSELLAHNMLTLSGYLGEASIWIVEGLYPLQEGSALLSHNMGTLADYLGQASIWVVDGLFPLSTAAATIGHNIETLGMYLGQASGWIAEAFFPIAGTGSMVNHNLSTLGEYLGQSSGWVVGAFFPMQSGGMTVNHNLGVLAQYLGQASGWVVGGFLPIQSGAAAVNHNLSTLASYLGKASGWVASINGIQGGAASVQSALYSLSSRIRSVRINSINVPGGKPAKNATGGHITKPTLSWVGEAGNEFIIPYENHRGRGRMLLQQAASALGMSVNRNEDQGNNKIQFTDDYPAKLDEQEVQAVTNGGRISGKSSKPNVEVNLNFTGDNHYSDEMDAEKVAAIAVDAVGKALEEGLNTEGGGVYDI